MEDNQLNIIERFLNGELQGSELEGFEYRLDADEDLAAEVEQQRQAKLAAEVYFQEKLMQEMLAKGQRMLKEQKHRSVPEVEAEEKVVPLKPSINRSRRLSWMAAAASALIILSIAGWQFGWFELNRTDPVAVVSSYYELEGVTNSGLLNFSIEENTLTEAIEAFERQDFQKALLGFNELLADPSFPQKNKVLLLSGIALTQTGASDQAIQRFGEIPSSARTFYLEAQWQKAYTLWKNDDKVAAMETWSSIADDPSHPRQNDAQAILKKL